MEWKETVLEVIKNLIATGRTKFLATIALDSLGAFVIWREFVEKGWQVVVTMGILALITIVYFLFRNIEQINNGKN